MYRHTHYPNCMQGDLGSKPTPARVYVLRDDNEPKHNVWLKLLESEIENLHGSGACVSGPRSSSLASS